MVLANAKESFAMALKDAQSIDLVNNMASVFDAAIIVNRLEQVLTNEVMDAVFMPLMNKRIGFLTDHDPNKPNKNGVRPVPYSREVVRTAIIDAAMVGLQPIGNQFNIISGTMYPAKAGFSAILQRMKQSNGLIYNFEFDPEVSVKSADPSYMAIPCRISYKTNRDDLKGFFKYVAMVKINGETSSTDQLRGKAERKCKKAFVEFLTGLDLGDADASETVDVSYTEVKTQDNAQPVSNSAQSATDKAKELLSRTRDAKPAEPQQPQTNAEPTIQQPQSVSEQRQESLENFWNKQSQTNTQQVNQEGGVQ